MRNNIPIKILVVSTMNMNLGDTVLADNDIFLLEKALKKYKKPYILLPYSISSRDTFQLQFVDALVFAGGILKETNESFWLYIPELIEAAYENNVPVFMSAIGVEAFHGDSEKSNTIKIAINRPNVKGISVRDDIDTLFKDYITNPDIRIKPVLDPAIWCKKCYANVLPKKLKVKNNTIIGLGIVRDKLFADYGNPQIDEAFQLDYWTRLIKLLEDNGYKWEIFTNGDTYDERFAKKVLKAVGHGKKLPAPRDGAALVKLISHFRGLICGRMHSNIIAYSLEIPSIGFIWNQKLRFWSEKIGHPERFIEPANLNPELSFNLLQNALKEKTGPSYFKKRPVAKELEYFVKNYCVNKTRATLSLPYQSKMIAASLGGIEKRYKGTNSPDALKYSAAHGYANFELNIRLSQDKQLICSGKWCADLYHRLNVEVNEDKAKKAMKRSDYLKQTYFNRFKTADFDQMISTVTITELPDAYKLLINLGKPSVENLELMLTQMKEVFEKYNYDTSHLLIRLEDEESVECFKASEINAEIVYHFSTAEKEQAAQLEALTELISYCKAQDIRHISMKESLYYEVSAKLLNEAGIGACVFTVVKTERIADAIKWGVEYIGSRYYEVDYMSTLTS